jgi:integrase
MSVPQYRRHPNGQAFVYHKDIPTSDHRLYLGRHGSDESRRRYRQFLARVEAGEVGRTSAEEILDKRLRSIAELVVVYLEYAERYYVDETGGNTSEFHCSKEALRPLVSLFGDEPGSEFGPRALTLVQNRMVEMGYARRTINSHVGRCKRFFRWCSKMELIPPGVYDGLRCVDGLRKGKSRAKETEPVRPVAWEHVEPILPFVSPTVSAMIQTQYYCGMRPGDVILMRRVDIDTSADIWIYQPKRHKNSWRGQSLIKAIPKIAQPIVAEFFKPDLEAWLFSPQDSDRWHRKQRAETTNPNRKTPVYPSELKRRQRERARTARRPSRYRDRYDTLSYRQAIHYGIRKANKSGSTIPVWSPNQLRHGIATEISKSLGQQAAQRWLGHAQLDTTGIYVEKQISELIAIAQELDRRWA